MPVTWKGHAEQLEIEFNRRVDRLASVLRFRELNSASEGTKGSWRYPDQMRITAGSALDLRLAVKDFKSVLKEIGSLK